MNEVGWMQAEQPVAVEIKRKADLVCAEHVEADDELVERSEEEWCCEDTQSANHDGHEEEVDKTLVIEVVDDRARVNDGACEVYEGGDGQDETGDEVHGVPDGSGNLDHAEVQGGGLPHTGEGEEGKGDGIVGNVPLDDEATPSGDASELVWGRSIHHVEVWGGEGGGSVLVKDGDHEAGGGRETRKGTQ